MANIKYRSLKIKFVRMGRKRRWFYYLWLFKNKKKFKLLGRYFPQHFKIDNQLIRVCIMETTLLSHYIRQGAVCEPKVGKLFQGLL